MRKLLIEIDGGETNCDGCQHFHQCDEGYGCAIFAYTTENTNMLRPIDCHDAELKAQDSPAVERCAAQPASVEDQKIYDAIAENYSAPVGAAPLPDDVKAMAERVRYLCHHDISGYCECAAIKGADMIERLAANRAPEGMVLVPREPTKAMYATVDNERLAQIYWRKLITAGEIK